MLYWLLKRILLGPILRLLFRPTVEGLENLPEDGPAILASNHLSFSDSIFLPLMVPRRITFLAKSDYFTGSGLKGRLTAAFFRAAGQVPVDRSGGSAGNSALRSGLRVMSEGDLLGIYPEGTRSPDGRLYRGRTEAQPTGQLIPSIRPITVRIGAPLDFSRYEGMAEDRFVLRSITDEIMYELMLLSGQEYVDVYAATQKKRLLAAAKARAKDLETKLPTRHPQSAAPVRDIGVTPHPQDGEPTPDVVDGEAGPGESLPRAS